ncbi:hypothetical protein TGRUB_432150, partial [Toxoplasma gondii RUB]
KVSEDLARAFRRQPARSCESHACLSAADAGPRCLRRKHSRAHVQSGANGVLRVEGCSSPSRRRREKRCERRRSQRRPRCRAFLAFHSYTDVEILRSGSLFAAASREAARCVAIRTHAPGPHRPLMSSQDRETEWTLDFSEADRLDALSSLGA